MKSKRFTPIIALVALCWLVFVANNLLWSGRFNQWGIVPRRLGSLPAIIWAPLLHGSFRHLAANTLPLLILGGIICARSKSEFAVIAGAGALLGGGLTWLFARNACHIGASGLIFCFFGYLASLAYFRRTFRHPGFVSPLHPGIRWPAQGAAAFFDSRFLGRPYFGAGGRSCAGLAGIETQSSRPAPGDYKNVIRFQ